MAVVLTEWEKKITWWTGIEVTANKVVNLLLREQNNLIKVDNNNYVYTDLQLASWITPEDTIPVWVTTGRVLEADWWDVTWTMLAFKTTSWDTCIYIYWDDWKLYVDNWTWELKQVYLKSEVDALFAQLRSELSEVAFSWDYDDLLNKPTLWTVAPLDAWYNAWNVPVIWQDGTLPSSILPAMAMKAFTVDTLADLTTLSDAIAWDIWYVTAENKTYILVREPYSVAANWEEYTAVNSVNWYRGVVRLTTNDIPIQWTTNMYVTSTEKSIWNSKLALNDVATVATTGNYNDLNNKPSIDTVMSDSSTNAVQNKVIKAYVDTTAWSSAAARVSDTAYWSSWNWDTWVAPSKNAVYDKVNAVDNSISTIEWNITTIQWQITNIWTDKQDKLVSGTNIKTINNTSILGSWNIDTNQVSDTAFWSSWDWDTTHAPSKNAVYDVLWGVETLLANI